MPLALALCLAQASSVAATEEDGGRGSISANAVHPPIGVFGDIAHSQGDVMLSYRYQRHGYDGLMNQRTELTAFPAGFDVAPTAMRQDTHLLEVFWAPLSEITFVLTLPYFDKEMDLITSGGMTSTTRAKGFGDFVITVLYRVYDRSHTRVHLNLGLSLPSGSTNESQRQGDPSNMTETLMPLPYIMQLGSGTVDLRPGVTYNGAYARTYWGGQVTGVLHAGTNSRGYRLGNSYDATVWAGQRWADWFATGFRLDWSHWFNPDGSDPFLDALTLSNPANDPTLQGGRRLDALFSIDFYLGGGLSGTRISVEAGLPAYQYLEGPQLRTQWILTTGLQYAF